MKIAIASDHAGYELKQFIKEYLLKEHYEVIDFGTNSSQSVDYPDFIYPAALAVSRQECERGIFVDGAGYPSAALANIIFGVYAAVCNDSVCARLAREHSDTNVLCLGGKLIGTEVALEIVKVWLTTPFLGGKYQRRLDKVKKIEEQHLRPPELQPLKALTVGDIKEAVLNKKPLFISAETIITPSVLEWVNEIR